MKKTIAILLALCMCVGLCACGGNSAPIEPEKSAEAQKADELILAIGEVSLEKESAVLAAKAYYDTLTAEQKVQVENAAVLDAAVTDLDELKKEVEYKEIYEKALEYEDNSLIDEAYAEYKKLPSDYLNVAQRVALLEPYVGLLGYWVCEDTENVASDGTNMTDGIGGFILECGGISEDTVYLNYSAALESNSDLTNNSIFKGAISLLHNILSGGINGKAETQENGYVYYGKTEAGRSDWGDIDIMFYINSNGNLEVKYIKTYSGNDVSVIFEYIKK